MDVDTGVDDALAIMLALHSPDVSLVGITTTYGNTTVEQATLNTRFLLDRFGLEGRIPVVAGAGQSLKRGRSPTSPGVHGEDGLGGLYLRFVEAGWKPPAQRAPQAQDAADFILEQARRYGPDLTLIATAPITNLGLAIQRAPADFRRIGALLIMGGAVEIPGNINRVAEWNASRDPEALDLVLRSGVRTVLFPLDVTRQVTLASSALTDALGLAPEKLQLIRDLTARYVVFYAEHRGSRGAHLHDATPVAYLIRPELFRLKSGRLVVDCSNGEEAGRTRWAAPGEDGAPISVAVEADQAGFFELFWGALRRTPQAG